MLFILCFLNAKSVLASFYVLVAIFSGCLQNFLFTVFLVRRLTGRDALQYVMRYRLGNMEKSKERGNCQSFGFVLSLDIMYLVLPRLRGHSVI